jgi:aryl-alcohol dehydrogenase-like predicted oxidoreductase
MEYRRLGKSGVKVSEVALGSWLTYGGATENETATQCIHRAYELGINFFDTANVYARGESEKVVGAALKISREIRMSCDKSLLPNGRWPERSRTVAQAHHGAVPPFAQAPWHRLHRLVSVPPLRRNVPLEETLRALDDLVSQGKVLYVGVSEWNAQQSATPYSWPIN